MTGFFDTNILIDYLNGDRRAEREFSQYDRLSISLISWMEVLVGAESRDEEVQIKTFLSQFQILEISRNIAEMSVNLRKLHKMRLPDAIIWASAKELNAPLITRNAKDFPRKDPSVKIPY